jgi:hypothetical protein
VDKLLSKDGTDIIGFIPDFSLSNSTLMHYMSMCGITLKGNQKKSITCLKQWLMQECLKNIFYGIYEMNRKGPVKMIIGTGGPTYDVMLCFSGIHGNYTTFEHITLFFM